MIERSVDGRRDVVTLGLSALLGLLAGSIYVGLGARGGTLQFLAYFILGAIGAFHRRVLNGVDAPRYLFWAVCLTAGIAMILVFWPWMGDSAARHRLQFAYGSAVCGLIALAGMTEWWVKAVRRA